MIFLRFGLIGIVAIIIGGFALLVQPRAQGSPRR